jgi:hypothetical protein
MLEGAAQIKTTALGLLGTHQMLSLRSLADILYSAIRLSRAAFLRLPSKSRAPINVKKMATKMATYMATYRAGSMSVCYKQFTPSAGANLWL